MLNLKQLKKYYSGKKVLITGHTGIKGSYMCVLLSYLGAKVYGYSLKPEKGSLYELLTKGYYTYTKVSNYVVGTNADTVGATHCEPVMTNVSQRKSRSKLNKLVELETFADIRDYKKLKAFVKKVNPDFVIHMAAQPLVLKGYEEPKYTYEVNVMGTVNLLESIRELKLEIDTVGANADTVGAKLCEPFVGANADAVGAKLCEPFVGANADTVGANANTVGANACGARSKKSTNTPISILNVTTDKVYENNDLSNYAFKENDKLCGRDPYANSKSCSEIVTYAYEKSFLNNKNLYRISTARAGNVIGGGDLNKDRIIPDCYRSIKNKSEMIIRNPMSIRPYQYVLEPLILYLNILAYQIKDKKYEGNYNIGPDKKNCLTTKTLTEKFFKAWKKILGANAKCRGFSCEPAVGANTGIVGAKHCKSKSPHEAKFLRLDNSLIKKVFNYKEIFSIDETIEYTTKVYYDMLNKNNIYESILNILQNLGNL